MLYFDCLLAVMWPLVVCVSFHGVVGWSVVFDSGHAHLDVYGDTEIVMSH